jgi:hypothetical protein
VIAIVLHSNYIENSTFYKHLVHGIYFDTSTTNSNLQPSSLRPSRANSYSSRQVTDQAPRRLKRIISIADMTKQWKISYPEPEDRKKRAARKKVKADAKWKKIAEEKKKVVDALKKEAMDKALEAGEDWDSSDWEPGLSSDSDADTDVSTPDDEEVAEGSKGKEEAAKGRKSNRHFLAKIRQVAESSKGKEKESEGGTGKEKELKDDKKKPPIPGDVPRKYGYTNIQDVVDMVEWLYVGKEKGWSVTGLHTKADDVLECQAKARLDGQTWVSQDDKNLYMTEGRKSTVRQTAR